jgi:beta-lactamase superfamily II metal-dependent hydrolase
MKRLKRLFYIFALLPCLLLSSCSKQTGEELMTITILQAGKADAIVIQSQGQTVLIDTGLEENSSTLLEELDDLGVDEVDVMIITHFDKDHAGGAAAVLGSLDVGTVYTTYAADDGVDLTDALAEAGLTAQVVTADEDVTFTIGSASFTIEGAQGNYSENEDNNSSLITTVTCGTKTYLFMGDAQKYRIEEYLAEHDDTVDFLKVPYHGHYMSCLKDLYAVLQPDASVITDSDTEPDSSEVSKSIKLLKQYGTVYETKNGTVTVHCYESSFTVDQ